MNKLKFFADHCVPNSIIEAVKNMGFGVLKLKDFIPHDSTDHSVISKAQRLNAVLLPLNGDFADITTYPPVKYKGIIAVRLRNHPPLAAHIIKMLKKYFSPHADMAHYKGKLLVVDAHRIRIKM